MRYKKFEKLDELSKDSETGKRDECIRCAIENMRCLVENRDSLATSYKRDLEEMNRDAILASEAQMGNLDLFDGDPEIARLRFLFREATEPHGPERTPNLFLDKVKKWGNFLFR